LRASNGGEEIVALRKELLMFGALAAILTALILVLVLTTNERRTPPSVITGLIATDTSYIRSGQIDLAWHPSDASDFAYYSVYAAETEITDITGLSPVGRINDRTDVTYETTRYGVPGIRLALFAFLEDTEYWFTVTAVDASGNESEVGTSISAIIEKMPAPPPIPTVFIRIMYMGFQPETVTVPIGTTVAWTNMDEVDLNCYTVTNPHTVTSDIGLFHGDLTSWDIVFTYTFTETGIFGYYDQIGVALPWLPERVLAGEVIVVE
jgi:plastocyanin